jgi:branched-chain amino acid transport system permease protein
MLVPELLNWALRIFSRFFDDPNTVIVFLSPVKMMILGFLIVFFIHVEPTGLAGIWRRIRDYFKIWPLPYV